MNKRHSTLHIEARIREETEKKKVKLTQKRKERRNKHEVKERKDGEADTEGKRER